MFSCPFYGKGVTLKLCKEKKKGKICLLGYKLRPTVNTVIEDAIYEKLFTFILICNESIRIPFLPLVKDL